MSWIAAAVVGAAVVGGITSSVISSKGQQSAAETQAASAENASQLQYRQYQQQRADLAPWRIAGENALATLGNKLEAGPGEFEASPSYQFALEEGQKGIQRAASATGRLGSGAYLKDATKYAKNLASEEYQNFLNRYYQSLNPYLSVAGLGQTGAIQSANAAGQYGQAAGQNALYAGNATAAGQLGQANTWANTVNWAGQQGLNYAYQNQMQNQMTNQQMFPAYGGVNSPTYGYTSPSQMNAMTWL